VTPTGADAGGLALTAAVGLAFVAYAVLAWVAPTHRRCVAQFRRPADDLRAVWQETRALTGSF
jgi:hypothetical protein